MYRMDEATETYVKNEDNLIYKIASHEQCSSSKMCYNYNLHLVAGYDYINPDENDIQGYVKPERFIEDVQTNSITVYPMEETLKDRLEEEGYTILEHLPRIY